jgi:hypothetical protein
MLYLCNKDRECQFSKCRQQMFVMAHPRLFVTQTPAVAIDFADGRPQN